MQDYVKLGGNAREFSSFSTPLGILWGSYDVESPGTPGKLS